LAEQDLPAVAQAIAFASEQVAPATFALEAQQADCSFAQALLSPACATRAKASITAERMTFMRLPITAFLEFFNKNFVKKM
jgi:hypothetical protein